jgi:hypothetical protein
MVKLSSEYNNTVALTTMLEACLYVVKKMLRKFNIVQNYL